MAAAHYNPCADGFAAKAWECLRRNKSFRQACDKLRNPECDIDDVCLAQKHPFHSSALWFAWLQRQSTRTRKRPTILPAWKELPRKMQSELHDALKPGDATNFPIPYGLPQHGIFPSSSKRISNTNSKILDLLRLLEFAGIGDTHQLIAVPKFIWDPKHNEKIREKVGTLLTPPCGNVKWLNPIKGRTLGIKKKWESYLHCEEWTEQGFSIEQAIRLSTNERFAGEFFGIKTEERVLKAKSFLESFWKKNRNYSVVANDVQDVISAIESVYPEFSPFSPSNK